MVALESSRKTITENFNGSDAMAVLRKDAIDLGFRVAAFVARARN